MTEFASVQFHHLAEYHTSVWTSSTFDQMTGIGPRFFKNANQLLGETINPDLSVCQETRGWEKARPELISFSTTIFCQPVKASHFRHSQTLFIDITPLLSVCVGEDTTFHFKSKYFNQKKKKKTFCQTVGRLLPGLDILNVSEPDTNCSRGSLWKSYEM